MKYIAKNEEETVEIGGKIASKLKSGDILCLYGDLGAGKTTLVKGLARALGIKKEVTSPTFALMNLYDIKNRMDSRRSLPREGWGGNDKSELQILRCAQNDKSEVQILRCAQNDKVTGKILKQVQDDKGEVKILRCAQNDKVAGKILKQVQDDRGVKQLVHFDLYRLKNKSEFYDIGGEDYLGSPDTICVIEWPEKIAELLKNKKTIDVTIEHKKNGRIITSPLPSP